MNEYALNVDFAALKQSQNKLLEEKEILLELSSKLACAMHKLEACWEGQASPNFQREYSMLSTGLPSLAHNMEILALCMDFALKTYSECEKAAGDSVKAANL